MVNDHDTPPHHRRWTQTDITALRGLVLRGASAGEISALMERPLDNVDRMLVRLRLVRSEQHYV